MQTICRRDQSRKRRVRESTRLRGKIRVFYQLHDGHVGYIKSLLLHFPCLPQLSPCSYLLDHVWPTVHDSATMPSSRPLSPINSHAPFPNWGRRKGLSKGQAISGAPSAKSRDSTWSAPFTKHFTEAYTYAFAHVYLIGTSPLFYGVGMTSIFTRHDGIKIETQVL